MQTVLATLFVFAAVMAAMAIGVIVTGRRLSGSCGGIPGKDCTCSATDRQACEQRAARVKAEQYDAADLADQAYETDARRHLSVWNERDNEDTLR